MGLGMMGAFALTKFMVSLLYGDPGLLVSGEAGDEGRPDARTTSGITDSIL
jgi:hypothetical protein